MRAFASFLMAISLLGNGSVSLAAQGALYHRDVNENNPGGKDLVMTFEERSRDEKTSLAKVTYKSGHSVASAMFITRGFYDIARIRNISHFIKLKEWEAEDGGRMYLVGFSNAPKLSPAQYFGVKQPSDASAFKFLAVKDFSEIFEGRK